MSLLPSHPILSCAEAKAWEEKRFGRDEAKEWPAMQQAGRALAAAVLKDFGEIGGFRADGAVLVLVGKGHNGGDALIAAQAVLEEYPLARVGVCFVYSQRALRPLAARAWRDLAQFGGGRVGLIGVTDLSTGGGQASWELCLDGVFGFQFRPPLLPEAAALFKTVNALPVRLRAAVDLPSGLDEADAFRADFTYATGILKTPLLTTAHAGRLRYLDLGFFSDDTAPAVTSRLLTRDALASLRGLRASHSDKRTYGHVAVLGGSRSYPGAIMMTALAALRSGAGLVTAFVPETLAPAYAGQVPEVMWVGWPETHDGGLAMEGQHLLRAMLPRLNALVIGPGLGREAETLALVGDLVKTVTIPVVLDADALQPSIVKVAKAPLVVTPHAGEFKRIAEGLELEAFAKKTGATVVLKGGVTQIAGGDGKIYHSPFGGPVLARGGSGDLLAGMVGAQLAQTPDNALAAASRGVVWHGRAADELARAHGAVAVRTTQVLDFLGLALRD